MSAPVIMRGDLLSQEELAEVRSIFFESSTKKDFKDEEEKEAFFWKYVGFYLVHHLSYFWVARTDRILGYVVGSPQSNDPELYSIQPHLSVFEEHFNDYPAHLHINCHTEARGLGVGTKLVKKLEEQMREEGIAGLHIMTGADSRNRSFYSKLGFDFEVTLNFEGHPILLMGKRLAGK